jgi:hypothetical protein
MIRRLGNYSLSKESDMVEALLKSLKYLFTGKPRRATRAEMEWMNKDSMFPVRDEDMKNIPHREATARLYDALHGRRS